MKNCIDKWYMNLTNGQKKINIRKEALKPVIRVDGQINNGIELSECSEVFTVMRDGTIVVDGEEGNLFALNNYIMEGTIECTYNRTIQLTKCNASK